MRYVHELFDPSTGDLLELDLDLDGFALDGVEHGSMEALVAAYVARMAELLPDGWIDLDGAPVRLRDLPALRRRGPAPVVREHPALRVLRDRLIERDPDLAGAVELVIGLAPRTGPAPAGGCRRGGRPDLPSGLSWPGRRLFLAQLDLRRIAPFDVDRCLPPAGMLYYFVSEDCTDNRALFWPTNEGLSPRDPPDDSLAWIADLYRSDLREAELEPYAAIRVASGYDGDVPDDLVRELSRSLALDVVLDDPGCRLLGSPDGEDGWGSLSLPEPDDPLDPATFVGYDGPYVLALQHPFAEGFVFLGVPPADLARGDLGEARATYWGT